MRLTALTALTASVVLTAVVSCRGRKIEGPKTEVEGFRAVVDSLMPAVEQAVGLRFLTPPRAELRSRDEVRRYLAAKLTEELPADRARGISLTYQLFGMMPDSVDLREVLLALLTEQVVGYYDPDSATLFGVAGAPETQRDLMAAHELVHALQGQHVALDSILSDRSNNDRTSAAQAVFEGQAMLASMQVVAGGQEIVANDEVWQLVRDQAALAQESMPGLGAAPMVIREGMLFPYIEGAEFMRWWELQSGRGDSVPFGPRFPASTEQVLHPERYGSGDAPVSIAIAPMSGATIHEDVLGELEVALLAATLSDADRPSYQPAIGWGGDRFRVVESDRGPALVWFIVLDAARDADRFSERVGRRFESLNRPGYRTAVERITIGERPAFRWVHAPESWSGWNSLPAASIAP
jgi:hypothetical protein